MKKIGLVLATAAILAGCTSQQMARQYGGTDTMDLPAGKKLVTLAWEETHLWYLMRDAKPGEKPESYEFKESSNFGLMQGTVIIREH